MAEDRPAEPPATVAIDVAEVRRTSGTAAVVGFEHADDLLAAMIAATHAALESAIAERLWRQTISDRGDAAATLFLDAARVKTLLQSPTEAAPERVAQLRALAERRQVALLLGIEATPDHGPPLARAIRQWQLAADAIPILLHAISLELTPRLARLAAFLGGDASRAGVIVEAMAALLGAEEQGVAALVRQLAPGGPLYDLAVLLLRSPELPLLHRPVWLAPRVIELALGSTSLDDLAGATMMTAPPAGSVPNDSSRAAIHAVLRRTADPVIGVVGAGRASALATIARVLADAGRCLLVTELSTLADDTRLAAIAREALLFDAAVAVRIDILARDAVRAARAIDRLAALAPVLLIGSGDLEPALPLTVGVIAIDFAPLRHRELEAAIAGAFPSLVTAAEVARVAAAAPLELGAVRRAAAAIAAQPFPVDAATAVVRALAEQRATPEGPGVRALPFQSARAVAPALATIVERVVTRWSASQLPRRLRLIVDGRAGTGKTMLATAVADRLGLRAFVIDPLRAIRGADQDLALANVVAAVAANSAVLVVENVDLLGARRPRPTGEPPFTMAWLGRLDGLVIVTTRDATQHMEQSMRREFDLAITVPFPDVEERRRLWTAAFARRGTPVAAADLDALARDFPFSPAQIERVALLAGDDPRAVRPEAERRSVLMSGASSGSEVE